MLGYTRFGRNVYAIGGNQQSALLMGLPVARTKIAVYAISGFCSALGGVLFTFYTLSGDPSRGRHGARRDRRRRHRRHAARRRRRLRVGTVLGVLVLGLIQTLITFEGTLSSWWTRIVIGALLLVFIVLQRFLVRHRS